MSATDVEEAEQCEERDDGPLIGAWPRDLAAHRTAERILLGRPHEEWCAITRRELRLPTGAPLIGSGHQATFWHPGVAMKLVAADEMARLTSATVWHLIVDSDAHPMGHVEVPVRDAVGTLRAVDFELAHDGTASIDAPTGMRPPLIPASPDAHPSAALPSVRDGLDALSAALQRAADEPDAAMQVTRAALDLLAPLLSSPPRVVRSAALLQTTLGRAILDAMRDDPRRCAETYNAAVGATHGAGTSLSTDGPIELPLWRVDPRGVRRRAHAADLDQPDGAQPLLPRALLLTAITRLAAADLFVHGTGGIAYDVAMVRWLHDWLGAAPAPACLVTATLRLPLPERDVPEDIVARAVAAQRRRWWDPQRFVTSGPPADGAASGRDPKRALVDAIDASPRNSRERAERYAELHRLLAELRERAATAIGEADRRVDDARRLAEGRPVAMSRTWPFAYHTHDALSQLAASTRAAVRDA